MYQKKKRKTSLLTHFISPRANDEWAEKYISPQAHFPSPLFPHPFDFHLGPTKELER